MGVPYYVSSSKNMTVAIIGTGRIGAATGKIYAGFGAKVVGYDAYPNHSLSFLEYIKKQ